MQMSTQKNPYNPYNHKHPISNFLVVHAPLEVVHALYTVVRVLYAAKPVCLSLSLHHIRLKQKNNSVYYEAILTKMKNVFTRQEVADAIGISKRTLERRIREADLDLPRHLLTITHVYQIYEALGMSQPDMVRDFSG
jgi:hypothetical protein